DDRLSALGLPEQLREALAEARAIRAHGARRRQLQYIGKLMRSIDAEPIRAALAAWQAGTDARALLHKRVEQWRERLLAADGEEAMSRLLAAHPGADHARLRTLVREAREERRAQRPPRAYRALYQALRTLLEEP